MLKLHDREALLAIEEGKRWFVTKVEVEACANALSYISELESNIARLEIDAKNTELQSELEEWKQRAEKSEKSLETANANVRLLAEEGNCLLSDVQVILKSALDNFDQLFELAKQEG